MVSGTTYQLIIIYELAPIFLVVQSPWSEKLKYLFTTVWVTACKTCPLVGKEQVFFLDRRECGLYNSSRFFIKPKLEVDHDHQCRKGEKCFRKGY